MSNVTGSERYEAWVAARAAVRQFGVTAKGLLGAAAWLVAAQSGCLPAFPERETHDAGPSPDDATALDGAAHDGPVEAAPDATIVDGETGSDGAPHDAGEDTEQRVDAEAGCGSGQAMCGDAGVCDDLSTDVRNCGACGTDCTQLAGVSQGSTITCKSGRCVYSCLSGYADCADAGTGCVSLGVQTECGACGVACDAGSLCSITSSSGAYACTTTCPTGTAVCGSTCVNETTNTQPNATNCGGCGSQYACTGGKVCASASCTCPSGEVDCQGTCEAPANCCSAAVQNGPAITVTQATGSEPTNWGGGLVTAGTYYATSAAAYGSSACVNQQVEGTYVVNGGGGIQSVVTAASGLSEVAAYTASLSTTPNTLDVTLQCGAGESFSSGYTATATSITLILADPVCGTLLVVLTKQ